MKSAAAVAPIIRDRTLRKGRNPDDSLRRPKETASCIRRIGDLRRCDAAGLFAEGAKTCGDGGSLKTHSRFSAARGRLPSRLDEAPKSNAVETAHGYTNPKSKAASAFVRERTLDGPCKDGDGALGLGAADTRLGTGGGTERRAPTGGDGGADLDGRNADCFGGDERRRTSSTRLNVRSAGSRAGEEPPFLTLEVSFETR